MTNTPENSDTSPTVVATVGDTAYTVPAVIPVHHEWQEDDGNALVARVSGELVVVDGRPAFRSLTFDMFRPVAPIEMQRYPWGRLAEGALEDKAVSIDGQRDPRSVNRARTNARKSEQARAGRARQAAARKEVGNDRLREVLSLKAKAEASTTERWDVVVARQLGYSAGYVRDLGKRARVARDEGRI